MADKRISDLPEITSAQLDPSLDLLALADISAAETKKVTPEALFSKSLSAIVPGSIDGSAIADNSIEGIKLKINSVSSRELGPDSVSSVHIIDGSVDNDKLAGGITDAKLATGIDGSKLKDNSVDSVKLTGGITSSQLAGGITGSQLVAGTLTTRELASDSVDTSQIVDAAITNDKLAGGITDSKLAAGIDGSKLQNLSIPAGKLAGGIANDQLAGSIEGSKLVNGAIDSAQIKADAIDGTTHIQDRSIPGVKLEANAVTSAEIAAAAVTSLELASNSVDTDKIIDDSITTPKYEDLSVTNDKLATGIDGAKITNGTITNSKLASPIDGGKIDQLPLDKLQDAAANTVLAGPSTGSAATPSFRQLVSTDLPLGTASAAGATYAPAGSGLVISNGALSIDNGITASGFPFVTFNAKGLITGGRSLASADLPAATGSSIGAVKPGVGITVSGDGSISQASTGVAAGEYTKLTTDERGNITAGTTLDASDIPNIDFNKIDNVSINSSQISSNAIQQNHIADEAITVVGDQVPPLKGTTLFSTTFANNVGGNPIKGTFWWDNDNDRLYVWEGTRWNAVFEDLSQNNLRYGGNVNADTGLITLVNAYGASAGYATGDAPRTVAKEQIGLYFVCDTASSTGAGFTVSQLSGTTFDAGDWILASKLGQAGTDDGWRRIDTITSGGGGGALTNHNLFSGTHADVVANGTIQANDMIKAVAFGGGIQWQNTNEIDCGSNDYA